MIYYLLILLFFALASICNSIMDTLDHHHDRSIFSKIKKNKMWWNFHEGWRNKYIDRDPKNGRVKWFWKINKPVQITDAWHFFKMLMIIFGATSIALSALNPLAIYIFKANFIYNLAAHLLILGTVWNFTFSTFYNKILIIKN